jgi:mono/diheme cytochrome c family protein
MPRWIIYALLVLISLSFVPLAFLAKARVTDSRSPRVQIVHDMDHQPKFKPQAVNSLFADGRAMRPPVAGTVARGDLAANDVFRTGKDGDAWVTRSPVRITSGGMQRGAERYGIFCAPCHGPAGRGDGMVGRRAEKLQEGTWIPATDLTGETVRARADGHLFNTITHGIRSMPAYGPQIDPEDRWSIVAYVRALQRSARTNLDDVPEDIRPTLR